MGSGCSSQDNVLRTQHRIVTRRVGNFTFLQHGKRHVEGRFTGAGCRKCPVWETQGTAEEVAKKREEFWDTRVEGRPEAWRVLRMAVEAQDASSALEIIKAAGLRLATDQLAQTYDETGVRYDIPPYILSEPVRYGKTQEPVPITVKEARLAIVIRSAKAKDQAMNVSNLQKTKELKVEYSRLSQLPIAQIRLFFNGREMKDDDILARFNLSDQVVVQCMVSSS